MKRDFDVAIIGAGFGGLTAALALQREGKRSFVILDKNDDVGGTWLENTYPGCACDVPSHMYSLSFELNPNWSRAYAPQAEILAYIRDCVTRHQLRPHLRLGTTVEGAELEGDEWVVRLRGAPPLRVQHVVFGTGALNRPAIPNIQGRDEFRGAAFHSARWDHDYDLRGKRVAVIGTGASAVQFVPRIAEQVSQLSLFQRTPPWILPRADRAIGERERWLYRSLPGAMRLRRNLLYALLELRAIAFTVEPRLLERMVPVCTRFIASQISDPALRAKVTPSYTPGCKRLLLANDFYPTLERSNVELVVDGIERISASGVVTSDGVEREVDAIIYGTGFRVTDNLTPLTVMGRDGRDINEVWRERMSAYLGTTVSGFPNLYLLAGPNTGLGHNSMIFMLEAQTRYILSAMAAIDQSGARWAMVKADAQHRFNLRLQERLAKTVWATGCNSWYLDQAGHNSTIWPGSTAEFWLRTRQLHADDYHFG